jgi:hypothetical protein
MHLGGGEFYLELSFDSIYISEIQITLLICYWNSSLSHLYNLCILLAQIFKYHFFMLSLITKRGILKNLGPYLRFGN